MLVLAQLINENNDIIIKGESGDRITSKTKADTFIKAHYHQILLKCLRSEADSLWLGLIVTYESSSLQI